MKEIVKKIEFALIHKLCIYFRCKDSDGDILKIRVSDHCMNERNNYYRNERCISFITKCDRKQDSWKSNYEFVFNEDLLTENFETVEDILKDFELVNIID